MFLPAILVCLTASSSPQPAGKTIYVELKTEIGRLAKVQKWQRSELEKRGADVRVLFGMDAVKDFLREVFGDAVHTA